jgi:hypothetical protein
MKLTQEQLGILADSQLVATFNGRDGESKFDAQIPVADAFAGLTENRLRALIELAGDTLMHRKGPCKFPELPKVINPDDFWLVVDAVGTGGSRFKVTQKDVDAATTALKSYEMAPDQTKEAFEANPLNMGREFKPDREWLENHYKERRAAAGKPML